MGEDLTPVRRAGARAVSGTVWEPRKGRARDVLVTAHDHNLGGEALLGRERTDERGEYSIRYDPAEFCGERKSGADLVVRVVDGAGNVLATSQVIPNAAADERVDLVLGVGRLVGLSEYQSLRRQVEDVARCVPLAKLTVEDVDVLAEKTGATRQTLQLLLDGERAAADHELPAEGLYALLRSGLPADVAQLSAYTREHLDGILESAIAERAIPYEFRDRATNFLDRLERVAVEQAWTRAGDSALPGLLQGFLDSPRQRLFVDFYRRHEGTIGEFWRDLGRQPGFEDGRLTERVRAAVALANFTSDHLGLAARLLTRMDTGELASLRELARWRAGDWRRLMESEQFEPPGDSPDEPLAARLTAYALELEARVRDAFPGTMLRLRLAEDDLAGGDEVVRVLEHVPELNLATERLDLFFERHEAAFDHVADRAAVMEHLLAMQRVYRVTARYEEMSALIKAGLDSAQAIAALGPIGLQAQFGPVFGELSTLSIYQKADELRWIALALYTKYAPSLNDVPMTVLGFMKPGVEQVANFVTLFGPQDFCACADCRSALSPSAYLVDLLQFLKRGSTGPVQALDALFAAGRRPDIDFLELTCENANTRLPLIDLVNEILENAVASSTPPYPQTRGTEADLAATPEHLNPAAYTKLAAEVFPFDVPFSLGHEVARVFLGHLGLDRVALMRVLPPQGAPAEPTEFTIAAEYWKLAPLERDLILGHTAHDPWELWGLAQNDTIQDPNDPTKAVSGTFLDLLSRVHVMLQRSGMTYEHLLELLGTDFANPGGALVIASLDPHDLATCDTAKLAINFGALAPADAADRVKAWSRIIRWQRRTAWSFTEIQQSLDSLATTDIDEAYVIAAARLERLRIRSHGSLTRVLAWFGDLDTKGGPHSASLYAEVYLSKGVLQPVNPKFELPALTGTEPISSQLPTILAALDLPAADLALLLDGAASQLALSLPAATTATHLTLASLSELYRNADLARRMAVGIRDLRVLLALTGIDPFDRTNIGDTERLFDVADTLRRTGVRLDELDLLLRQVTSPVTPSLPPVGSLDLHLDEIEAGLAGIITDTRLAPDPEGLRLKLALATVLSANDAETAIAIVLSVSPLSAPAQEAFIDTAFVAFLPAPAERAAVKAKLVGTAALTRIDDRVAAVAEPLFDSIRRSRAVSFVKQKFSDALKIEARTAGQLLSDLLNASASPGEAALVDFLPLSNKAQSAFEVLTPVQQAAQAQLRRGHQRRTGLRLQKAAWLVARFRILSAELPVIFQSSAGGWFDLNALPVAPVASGALLFPKWERLAELIGLRDAMGNKAPDLFALLARPATPGLTREDYLGEVSQRTGRRFVDLDRLSGPMGFNWAYPTDFLDETPLLRLHACDQVLKRLGVNAAAALEWIGPDLPVAEGLAIRQAVKAKYEFDAWNAVAPPLQDQLRVRQRDALGSYLVHALDMRHRNDLFEWFLIDVEMSPCQKTSRTKQAISSVQLFIQRVLMRLESSVSISEPVAREYKWMHAYRLWEANRKIFLYPENWLEPDLRDDKSPFFQELENELMQKEVTQETAEAAYRSYMEKLVQVSRLEVRALTWQWPAQDTEHEYMHVFARTRTTPHTYFYRRWVDYRSWTPWERIDLDINGPHLVAVVHNRRLRLLWPSFETKSDQRPDEDITTPAPGAAAKGTTSHLEFHISHSTYTGRGWLARRTIPERFNTFDRPFDMKIFDPAFFKFSGYPTPTGGYLVAPVYASKAPSASTQPLRPKLVNGLWIAAPKVNETATARLNWRVTSLGISACSDGASMSAVVDDKDSHVTPKDTRYLNGVITAEKANGLWSVFRRNPSLVEDVQVLQKTPSLYTLVAAEPAPFYIPVGNRPFAFQDTERTYMVVPEDVTILWSDALVGAKAAQSIATTKKATSASVVKVGPPLEIAQVNKAIGYSSKDPFIQPGQLYRMHRFVPLYHPYACDLLEALNIGGIDALLRPLAGSPLDRQELKNDDFQGRYVPAFTTFPYPVESVAFDRSDAYALYNWEIFFHIPWLIADRLSRNQRFEEAHRWYQCILDPMDTTNRPIPARYWRVKPFTTAVPQSIADLLLALSSGDPQLVEQVREWRLDPFNPHRIARLRVSAYQRAIAMRFIDNLVDWADQLFRRDTLESINEATLLYVLAARILGERPRRVPARAVPPVRTYNDLRNDPLHPLDAFSNKLENLIAVPAPGGPVPEPGAPAPPTLGVGPLFCIPPNDKLLGYWDTVADRLYKIRHCMNIEGITRELPLFEPAIDPRLLVEAAAAGIDISSVLNDTSAPLPHYRFAVMAARATELCNEVRAGTALLSALERIDAEELTVLRSTHEIRLLEAARHARAAHVKESETTLESLYRAREIVNAQIAYFATRPFMNAPERAYLAHLDSANFLQQMSQTLEMGASMAAAVPQMTFGAAGLASAVAVVEFGGAQVAAPMVAASRGMAMLASISTHDATEAATVGAFERRMDDWQHQLEVARRTGAQIDQQILAAKVRVNSATRDLEAHDLQIEHARESDQALRERFTNAQLYEWTLTQISSVYFRTYQLAYDTLRRAERCFQFELGLDSPRYVQFGRWDSLRKGLLAGEKLTLDLKSMELAYLEQNRREYEITKTVSLAAAAPVALVQLKATGQCQVELPEDIFDQDYPGQYMRRIKLVSITIPCVTGPFTNVNCRLTLLRNSIRKSAELLGGQYRRQPNDPRFLDQAVGLQSVVTSSGQNDAGVFEPNLRDERYLPFEGAGAISLWHLELPLDTNAFDISTITDVLLHIRYTARESGTLRDRARVEVLQAPGRTGWRLFSARNEFGDEFYRLFHRADEQTLLMPIHAERFGFHEGRTVTQINRVDVFVQLVPGITYIDDSIEVTITPPGEAEPASPTAMKLLPVTTPQNDIVGVPHAAFSGTRAPGDWTLRIRNVTQADLRKIVVVGGLTQQWLVPESVDDIGILCRYVIPT